MAASMSACRLVLLTVASDCAIAHSANSPRPLAAPTTIATVHAIRLTLDSVHATGARPARCAIHVAVRRRQFVQTAAAMGVATVFPSNRTLFAQTTALATGSQAIAVADGVNVRGGPGSSQPIAGTLDSGMLVDLLAPSADGAWWRVANDAIVGYV